MGFRAYWRKVSRRAFQEAIKAAWGDGFGTAKAWGNLVVAAGVGALMGAGQSILTGIASGVAILVLWPLAFYLVKMALVPAAMQEEAESAAETNAAALRALVTAREKECADLKDEIRVLREPPPPPARDPDGIYQMGNKVATGHGAIKQIAQGRVTFTVIDGGPDFNQSKPFEYHDLKLVLSNYASSGTIGGMGLVQSQRFMSATCQIVGRV